MPSQMVVQLLWSLRLLLVSKLGTGHAENDEFTLVPSLQNFAAPLFLRYPEKYPQVSCLPSHAGHTLALSLIIELTRLWNPRLCPFLPTSNPNVRTLETGAHPLSPNPAQFWTWS
jgi:hypothetical protein